MFKSVLVSWVFLWGMFGGCWLVLGWCLGGAATSIAAPSTTTTAAAPYAPTTAPAPRVVRRLCHRVRDGLNLM